jgi:hypothetical protein
VSQPLIDLLKQGLAAGNLEGIAIGGNKQLLYQLYADDTGIFFNAYEENVHAIMDRLTRYENNSGAKINLSKSVLIQLDQGPKPGWFQQAGCAIAQD